MESITRRRRKNKNPCIVPGCSQKFSQRYYFPRDPEDSDIFILWMVRINNRKLAHLPKTTIIKRGYAICDNHFAEECKGIPIHYRHLRCRKLKRRSVPTLLLPNYPPKGEVNMSEIWPGGCVTDLCNDLYDPQILDGLEMLQNLDLFESKFLDIPNDFTPQFPELLESITINSRLSGSELNVMEIPNQGVGAEFCIYESDYQNDYEAVPDEFIIYSGNKCSKGTQADLFTTPTLEATQAHIKAFRKEEALAEIEKPYFKSMKSLLPDNNMMTEICRICFQSLETEDEVIKLYEPSLQQDSVQIKCMLKLVLPDLDLEIYRDNVICTKCAELLVFSYQLKEKWLSTEEKLQNMIERKQGLIQQDMDLVIVGKRNQNERLESLLLDHDYAISTKSSESTLPGSVDVPHETVENISRVESSDQEVDVIGSTAAKRVKRLTQKRERQIWGLGPYICEECGLTFTRVQMFQRHLRIHSPLLVDETRKKEPTTMCEICGQLCTSIKTHMRKHSEFKCIPCNKVFRLRSRLREHIARGHPLNISYQCHICGIQLLYKTSLKLHLKMHNPANRTVACHLCDRKFFHRSGLKKHLTRHGSLKLYTCTYCGKFLKYRISLEKHLKIYHLNEAQNVCEFCNKVYWKKCDLHKHRLRVHLSQESSKLPNEKTLSVKYEVPTCED